MRESFIEKNERYSSILFLSYLGACGAFLNFALLFSVFFGILLLVDLRVSDGE